MYLIQYKYMIPNARNRVQIFNCFKKVENFKQDVEETISQLEGDVISFEK